MFICWTDSEDVIAIKVEVPPINKPLVVGPS